jgi:hypothetical protein
MGDIRELFAKEMTRKEFLRVLGVSLLALLGVGNFISFLLHSQHNNQPLARTNASTRQGFGSGKFGV